MFTGCQKCLWDERDYFQCLLEYLKLKNVVVNAYFEREIQQLDIRTQLLLHAPVTILQLYFLYDPSSSVTVATKILEGQQEKRLSDPGEEPILYFLTMFKTSLTPNTPRIEGHRAVKRQIREADHSSPSSSKHEESLVLYLHKTKPHSGFSGGRGLNSRWCHWNFSLI